MEVRVSILNEKAIRKQVVQPQLVAAFGPLVEKADSVEITQYLLHQNSHELHKAVTGVIQQLTSRFGEDSRNRGLAVEMVTSVFRDDDD